jgi:hypothetical protein
VGKSVRLSVLMTAQHWSPEPHGPQESYWIIMI